MTKLPETIEIQKAIQDYVTAKGISKNDLAKKTGVSAGTLSFIETGKWESVSPEMKLRIWNAVKPMNWQLVPTANYSAVISTCEDARNRRRMLALVGSEGSGKTTALQSYYRNNRNVYYVSYDITMTSRHFLAVICREMGIQYVGSPNEMMSLIADELNSKPNALLIIDEADKMNNKMFMYLHVLRNKTMSNAGILLAGVEYLRNSLEKAVLRKKQGMAEFYSRVMAWQTLQSPTKAEIKEVCIQNGLTNTDKVKALYGLTNYRLVANAIENEKYLMNELQTLN
ncbi:MAG: AAA family ATPase [Bacteroidota bacterium]